MNNLLTFSPAVTFAARKKPTPSKTSPTPVTFPIHTITRSNGDGSYGTDYFASAAERDKALAWLEENDPELPCDADGTLRESDIYQSAADYIAKRQY